MDPTFFETPAKLRRWLEKNHAKADELWLGLHKKGTGKPSPTWEEVVDEVLCFGWIDGKSKRLDDESWIIRLVPRKPGSKWSARNVGRVEELTKLGRMTPAGTAAFEARKPDAQPYATTDELPLDENAEATLKANATAWEFFGSQPPGYRRNASRWVMSAKKPETRARRLAQLIEDSAAGRRIRPLTPPGRSRDAPGPRR
jgi:uncharacterized protein YdeI (YjbR/CyaY-like superfamily)